MQVDIRSVLGRFSKEVPPGGSCALNIEVLGSAGTLAEAWKLLPSQGEGMVVLADRIERFRPGNATGLLVEAEVAEGDVTTVVRMIGQQWYAWRWREAPGDSHQFFEVTYLSSEPAPDDAAPALRYRSYWALKADNDIQVWQPAGARFVGFARN